MSLGTLHILTLLHEPNKVHYGQEPICGTVSVRYTTSKLKDKEHAELFGPLKIRLRLMGSVEIGRASDVNNTKVCLKVDTIHDGPVKLMAGSLTQYPFEITFPPHADPKINSAVSAQQAENGDWKFHQRTTSVHTEPLPPTMRSSEREGISKRETAIRYVLAVAAEMPGFSVEIIHPPLPKEVLYDQPRMPTSATAMLSERAPRSKQKLVVRDEAFLGEEARPQGFRGKAKAILKHEEPPRYVFEVYFENVPKHIFVGQPVDLDLSVASNSEQSTAASFPPVSLQSASAALIAHTTSPRSSFDASDLVMSTETLKAKEAEIHPKGSFDKSRDHTKTISFGALSYVPSSFRYADIVSRTYKLRLMLAFLVCGQTVNCMRQFDVVVHPPLLLDEDEQPPSFDAVFEEDLPSYDEVVAGPSTASYLPA